MGENKDKNEHGYNARDALGNMLESMKAHDFIRRIEENYAICDEEYPKKDQFKAPFLIEFQNNDQWVLFSTTSIRDRMKQQEWDTANIKRLNECVKRAYVVIPDGVKEEERISASRYHQEIVEHKRYSKLDGVTTLDATARLIQDEGKRLLAYGSGFAKSGNEFEEKIAKVLNDKQNYKKWAENYKLTDGYFYPLFLMIIKKLNLKSDEVNEITATTKIPSLATGGKPKTDVLVSVRINDETKIFTISCKRTEKNIVSVHEYSPERYALVLNDEDEKLKDLLVAFRDAGGIKAFTHTDELIDKMKLYGDKLARWGVGGFGDPNLTQPEIQCANYVITYNALNEQYSIHELNEYIDLCKQDKSNGGHYGTIFRWTRKSNNIQLKMKLL